jgi:hypothetical protein
MRPIHTAGRDSFGWRIQRALPFWLSAAPLGGEEDCYGIEDCSKIKG